MCNLLGQAAKHKRYFSQVYLNKKCPDNCPVWGGTFGKGPSGCVGPAAIIALLISGFVIVVGKSLSLRLTKASGLQLFCGTVSDSALCVAVALTSSLTGSASAVAELTQPASAVVETSLLRAALSDVSD